MTFKLGTSVVASTIAALVMSVSAKAADVAPNDVNFNDDLEVTQSLTGTAGDPVEGRKTFVSRKLGNCLACHAVSDLNDQLFHGNVGPGLDGVGDRYNEARLRAIVVDSKKALYDETAMPGFYSLNVGENPRKDTIGKTILTAQQVEDVVAYLATLK